jgi:adenine-specific DNA methylase
MRAIVRDTSGSPDVLELPHQALGFRVQAYGVTQQKDLFTRRQLVALTTFASLIDEVGDRMIGDGVNFGTKPVESSQLYC